MYRYLFHPESIVVIGASSNEFKPGGRVTKNIKENGYEGRLWAVNPGSSSIMGLPTYKTIDELPEGPELALVAIPPRGVRSALEALARKGTRAAIILTAGFGEKDEQGKQEEKKILEIANRTGMTIIGPNCSGFLTTTYAGKFAGLIPKLKRASVDFISGSGATVDFVMEQATHRGLSFSNVVNLGNSVQLGVEDILAMVDENYGEDGAPILMLYMELMKKPLKLLRHARSLTRKGCTIIGIKSGVTAAGKRAAASHTGAMATSDTAVQALFDKAGMIRVNSKADLINVACILTNSNGAMSGNRACIITDAGGPGVMLADELIRQGWEVPVLSERSMEKLSGILPPESAIANPIDCLPTRTAEQIKHIFTILDQEEKGSIDVAVLIMGYSGMSDNWEIYREVIGAMDRSRIPIIPVLSSATSCADIIDKFRKAGKFYFHDEVDVAKALGHIIRRPRIDAPQSEISRYQRAAIKNILDGQEEYLSPAAVTGVLNAAGFDAPPQIEVFEEEGLGAACKKIGFPLAMKVIGPLHKSDVGGVKLGITRHEEALIAWKELMTIHGASGVMLQQMADGIEIILGAFKEQDFGHLIMFGLGGIYTEVLKDVSFALAPLSREESLRMIRNIKGFPILEGVRGQKGMDLNLLSEYLVRLSLLVDDFPRIREIDLNPVKGMEDRLYVVDARIIQG